MAITRISYYKFICDTREDVANLPTQDSDDAAPMGATALVIDDGGNGSSVVILNSSGQWKDM